MAPTSPPNEQALSPVGQAFARAEESRMDKILEELGEGEQQPKQEPATKSLKDMILDAFRQKI
jgi:hypothetical protein